MLHKNLIEHVKLIFILRYEIKTFGYWGPVNEFYELQKSTKVSNTPWSNFDLLIVSRSSFL